MLALRFDMSCSADWVLSNCKSMACWSLYIASCRLRRTQLARHHYYHSHLPQCNVSLSRKTGTVTGFVMLTCGERYHLMRTEFYLPNRSHEQDSKGFHRSKPQDRPAKKCLWRNRSRRSRYSDSRFLSSHRRNQRRSNFQHSYRKLDCLGSVKSTAGYCTSLSVVRVRINRIAKI